MIGRLAIVLLLVGAAPCSAQSQLTTKERAQKDRDAAHSGERSAEEAEKDKDSKVRRLNVREKNQAVTRMGNRVGARRPSK